MGPDEDNKPSRKQRLATLLLNIPFPIGLAGVAIGVGMFSVAAGVIAAGVFVAFIGWLVER